MDLHCVVVNENQTAIPGLPFLLSFPAHHGIILIDLKLILTMSFVKHAMWTLLDCYKADSFKTIRGK